jgi:uncharacterized protein
MAGHPDAADGAPLGVCDWTNTRYRMLYMNMGHGDRIFTSELQNRLFEDAILWIGTQARSK